VQKAVRQLKRGALTFCYLLAFLGAESASQNLASVCPVPVGQHAGWQRQPRLCLQDSFVIVLKIPLVSQVSLWSGGFPL